MAALNLPKWGCRNSFDLTWQVIKCAHCQGQCAHFWKVVVHYSIFVKKYKSVPSEGSLLEQIYKLSEFYLSISSFWMEEDFQIIRNESANGDEKQPNLLTFLVNVIL